MQHTFLPYLPGYNFEKQTNRKTNFHTSHLFNTMHNGICYMTNKSSSGEPSIFLYEDALRIPAWLVYSDQRLTFDAFFQEVVQEKSSFRIRIVKIFFFLEDDTIKIVEPCVYSSGLKQVVLVRRQRIPLSGLVQNKFYDVTDLNIGKEPEIFKRVYKIVNCDKFTRIFLNRMGIPVPDPTDYPLDPYDHQKNTPVYSKKPNRKVDTLEKFLKNDGKVLKFSANWDEFGFIHFLELRYYLTDDTIEIIEIIPSDVKKSSVFLKRMKIPKVHLFILLFSFKSSQLIENLNENYHKGFHWN
ncbi:hypothetical protein HCN44_008595 [Aphidius gifuensis]|uniref:DM10 domain-containing protein n=1 Tax=Aphidius gifuensis TaxID=684658 RepID=A0A834XNG1_APHGI|nr:hypothetical protein HCN44_008595 [Aphidius gifuensis]